MSLLHDAVRGGVRLRNCHASELSSTPVCLGVRMGCSSWLTLCCARSTVTASRMSRCCGASRRSSARSARLGSIRCMAIKLENVGIAVRDLEATISFFTDLGLTVVGRDTVSGEWADTAVGLDGNHAHIAMLQTPDGHGRLELFEYIHPEAIESKPTRPNEIGMHRVAFSVDNIDKALETAAKHGCRPLRGVATYEDVYKLTYVRGPSGIIVMLAEELKKN
jgi:glyoxylase I family protein